MFNFIKNIFSLFKSTTIEEEPSPVVQKLASLTIEVNPDGTMNILCDWPDFNENNAESIKNISNYYALAIHALCNGYLEEDIMDTLKCYDKDNVFNALFAHNTLIEIGNVKKLSEWKNTDKPIISPLEVFKTEE
tara:strand:+ start:5472 stop:5873 length:402 start_codon:yes stop_codon:yes gene_type:complete